MIKDYEYFQKFNRALIKKEKTDFFKNLKIVNELHKEAKHFGVFGKNPLDGIETDLKIASIINVLKKTT